MSQARATNTHHALQGVAELPSLGGLRVHGEDAVDFLNAQLTGNVPTMSEPASRLAGWCDAKGRTLAVFRVLRLANDDMLLLAASDLIPVLQQRLRMFVLRARVTLEDIGEELVMLGVFGDQTAKDAIADAPPQEPGDVVAGDDCTLVRVPGAVPRFLAIGAAALRSRLTQAPARTRNEWAVGDIQVGLPHITTATSGEFVPQMLNLHWLGGIDFQKGCYPGQEVVARLQFRGQLKRRVHRAAVDGAVAPGDPVTDADTREGMVLQAAETADGEHEVLAVIRVDAPPAALTIRGQPLRLLALPYETSA